MGTLGSVMPVGTGAQAFPGLAGPNVLNVLLS